MTPKRPAMLGPAIAALVLTACGSSSSGAPGSTTAPTQPLPSATPAPSPSSAPPSAAPTSTASSTTATTVPQPANCGAKPSSPAITDHIGAVPRAQQTPDTDWQYRGDSNYNACSDLSYAVLELSGGTGASPQQVMLFHQGRYIGTTTKCAFGFTSVTAPSDDSIGVNYRWPRQGDSNANPSGQVSITYRWDGTAVQMRGTLPAELLTVSGCRS